MICVRHKRFSRAKEGGRENPSAEESGKGGKMGGHYRRDERHVD